MGGRGKYMELCPYMGKLYMLFPITKGLIQNLIFPSIQLTVLTDHQDLRFLE